MAVRKCLREVSNGVGLHEVVHGGALWNGAAACCFLQLQTLLESMLCVQERKDEQRHLYQTQTRLTHQVYAYAYLVNAG